MHDKRILDALADGADRRVRRHAGQHREQRRHRGGAPIQAVADGHFGCAALDGFVAAPLTGDHIFTAMPNAHSHPSFMTKEASINLHATAVDTLDDEMMRV